MTNIPPARVRIWDLPTRIFHVAFALSVIGAIVCAKLGAQWMTWHMRLGIIALALLVFRLIWGFAGPRYAKFSQFLTGPGRVLRYLRQQKMAGHAGFAGHNPAGGWSVVAMLAIIGLQGVTGLFANDEILVEGPLVRFVSEATSSTLTGIHKLNEKPLFAILALHLIAITVYTIRGQRLVPPMFSGDARGIDLPPDTPATRDNTLTRLTALLIATVIAMGAAWLIRLT